MLDWSFVGKFVLFKLVWECGSLGVWQWESVGVKSTEEDKVLVFCIPACLMHEKKYRSLSLPLYCLSLLAIACHLDAATMKSQHSYS